MKQTAAVLAAATTFLIGACASPDDTDDLGGGGRRPDLQLVSSLDRFDSCEDLRSWVDDEMVPRVGPDGFPGAGHTDIAEEAVDIDFDDADPVSGADREVAADVDGAADGMEARADSSAPAPAADESAGDADVPPGDEGPEFSETNVQVQGIDEPDIVKTDGQHILALVDGRLHLVAADDHRLLDTLELPDHLHAQEMILWEDRVVLFGSIYETWPTEPGVVIDDGRDVVPDIAAEMGSTTVVQVGIDGDDLEAGPSFLLEGGYISARRIDEVLRLVLHADVGARLPLVRPAGPSEGSRAAAEEANRAIVADADAEDLLPRWHELDGDGRVVESGVLLGCEQAHAPEAFAGFGMVTVATINLDDGLDAGVTSARGAGVMADAHTVYAAPDHLYVAAPEWIDWQTGEATDDWPGRVEGRYGTDIHRFDITDPSRAVYDRSGWVDGELLNQFALDEHDGYLRVATTTGSPWGDGDDLSESHVTVLGPGDGALTEVGSVSGLGYGESIFAVRFMGEMGYVVTFEEVDPLYTIDLSDPTDPREVGELKILGYSAYLHPVGDGMLVGVGRDGTETGRLLGTQVSLFDVRDPAEPTLVAQETVADADSAAEWDHRAFLWWPAEDLVAVPVSSYEGSDPFEGLVGYTVDIDGSVIVERGRVSHPDQEITHYHHETEVFDVDDPGWDEPMPWSEAPPIVRSLVIGDDLWTLSWAGLAVTDMATFETDDFIAFH